MSFYYDFSKDLADIFIGPSSNRKEIQIDPYIDHIKSVEYELDQTYAQLEALLQAVKEMTPSSYHNVIGQRYIELTRKFSKEKDVSSVL